MSNERVAVCGRRVQVEKGETLAVTGRKLRRMHADSRCGLCPSTLGRWALLRICGELAVGLAPVKVRGLRLFRESPLSD